MYQRLGNLYKTQRIGAFELGDDAAAVAPKPKKVKRPKVDKYGRFAKWLFRHPKLAKLLGRGAVATSYKNKVVVVTPPPSSIPTPTPAPNPTTLQGYGDTTSSNYILYLLVIIGLVGGGFFLYKRHKAASPVAARRRKRK